MHPDAFLVSVCNQNRPRFLRAISQHRASLTNPPKKVEEYLSTLKALGLTRIAARLETYQDKI